MHKINYDGKVFVVEFTGTTSFNDIIDGIRDARAHSDFYYRNSIFVYSSGIFDLQVDQLELITQYILTTFITTSHPLKSAIVVPPGFNTSIVELWAESANRLPYELKIFSALWAAEEWVGDGQ